MSRSGYYAWLERPISERNERHIRLLGLIRQSHKLSDESYGYPRVYKDLLSWGESVGRNQVANLMRQHGIVAKMKRREQQRASSKRSFYSEAQREGVCPTPSQGGEVWVGDITQINTQSAPLFLACVMDRFTRNILGAAMSKSRNAELVCQALLEAINNRPEVNVATFHSDQGVEYASLGYRALLEKHGISRSVSRRGNCYDNAHMESFFHSLKTEMVYFESFATPEEGKGKIMEYITYYNHKRRHSSLGYLSPVQFELAVA